MSGIYSQFLVRNVKPYHNRYSSDLHLYPTPAMTGADLARDKREGRQDESESSADERCPVSKLLLENHTNPIQN